MNAAVCAPTWPLQGGAGRQGRFGVAASAMSPLEGKGARGREKIKVGRAELSFALAVQVNFAS